MVATCNREVGNSIDCDYEFVAVVVRLLHLLVVVVAVGFVGSVEMISG